MKIWFYLASWQTWCAVMPKEICEKYPDDYITDQVEDAIGTGPYVVSEFVSNVSVTVERRDGYTPYTENNTGMDVLKGFDAIFLGAVGYPNVPDHISLRELLLKIRRGFDQYVNLRLIKLLRGADSAQKDATPEDIDMLFVRENTEGEYCGLGSVEGEGTDDERVTQLSVFTRKGTERIIRYAFELARKNSTSCTSITKGNALNYSMVFCKG